MSSFPSSILYPSPSESALKLQYAGHRLEDIDGPAAVIDVAAASRNCEAMLKTTEKLGVGFRAHVKTHKTTELTKLQVGDKGPVNLVVSTVAEAEQLVPFLLDCRSQGRPISLLYGVPVAPSRIPRLQTLADILGPSSISVLVDNPSSVSHLSQLSQSLGGALSVFVKVDIGDHRSGCSPTSPQMFKLLMRLAEFRKHGITILGFYSHMGSSYAGGSPADALQHLYEEFDGVATAAREASKNFGSVLGERFTLSVGATPTATAAQNVLTSTSPEVKRVQDAFHALGRSYELELHAGVYPVLDMQQIATHARPTTARDSSTASLSHSNIALRMLVEVASLYNDRERPEALIGAGSIVLGREPCKSYSGWGVVTPWRPRNSSPATGFFEEQQKTGWIVGRISQEHGILTWEGDVGKKEELSIGQKLMVWPNHACIAGTGFGWYLVVDSESGDADVVRDVWVRWRGW